MATKMALTAHRSAPAEKPAAPAPAALLDAAEHRLWRAIRELGEAVITGVTGDLETRTGLSGAEYVVLARLAANGPDGMAQSELGGALGWHKSRLSHLLTRMTARHLVRRRRDRDTRNTHVLLTTRGEQSIEAAAPIHADAVRRHVLRFVRPDEEAALLALHARLEAREPSQHPDHPHTDALEWASKGSP
jgi:DNA-binding MarR family transcriptional regulator